MLWSGLSLEQMWPAWRDVSKKACGVYIYTLHDLALGKVPLTCGCFCLRGLIHHKPFWKHHAKPATFLLGTQQGQTRCMRAGTRKTVTSQKGTLPSAGSCRC